MATPTDRQQLDFLAKIQRLFAEGDFTATYKFALLMALAELAIEIRVDDGEPLLIRNDAIAKKFIEMYWQQAAPYSGSGSTPIVLSQNHGEQAAVIKAIVEFRRTHAGVTLNSASGQLGYKRLLRKVSQTASAQPINYLQNLGGVTERFLYQRVQGGLVLHEGVAFCLRRLQPLIQQLARTHWLEHVRTNRRNVAVIGEAGQLESFLFESSRQALAVVGGRLRQISNRRCFYCRTTMATTDVDHFVPFVQYPRDLVENFVLAHPTCNRSKSDTLAALTHLERWLEHKAMNTDALREIAAEAGVSSDAAAAHHVARNAYEGAHTNGGRAWIQAKRYEAIGESYVSCFG